MEKSRSQQSWYQSAVNALPTVNDIAHTLDIVKPSHVAVTGNNLEKVRAAIDLSQFGKQSRLRIFTVLDRVAGWCRWNTNTIPLMEDSWLYRFPEGVAGRTPDEALPAYDLRGKSAKQVPAFICFASGTTGKTKGIMLSHHNLIVNVLQCRIAMSSLMTSSNREVFFAPCKLTSVCHV